MKCSNVLTVAFGVSTLSQKSIYKWNKREYVNECPGAPTTLTSEEITQNAKQIAKFSARATSHYYRSGVVE